MAEPSSVTLDKQALTNLAHKLDSINLDPAEKALLATLFGVANTALREHGLDTDESQAEVRFYEAPTAGYTFGVTFTHTGVLGEYINPEHLAADSVCGGINGVSWCKCLMPVRNLPPGGTVGDPFGPVD